MAQTIEHTAGTGRPPSIVAVFADRNAAAAAAQELQNAGVDSAGIHDAGGSPAHPALARLPDRDRRAVSDAVAANGAVLVVTSRSQADHDRALSILGRPATHAGDADSALPDGIRGTTRDIGYTEPKDEHAGHDDAFPDHMPDRTPDRVPGRSPAQGAGTGLYIVHGD